MNRLVLLQNQLSSPTSYTNIILQTKGAVGIIYLNSPKTLNALTIIMRSQLSKALLQLDTNNKIKTIVILSKSPKAFCAGADIKEFGTQAPYSKWLSKDIFSEYYNTFGTIKKPIIAGVNGIAFGGGLETALLCDFVIFSQVAKIGLPEINLGLIPGIGGTQRLTKLIGKNLAMKHVLTGEPIDGVKLKEFGVADVISSQNFDQQVLAVAEKISQKSITALITAKMAVKASVELSQRQGEEFERAIFYPLFLTEGAKEGVTAFVEKRKADFTNK